jgi:hypothetical protein
MYLRRLLAAAPAALLVALAAHAAGFGSSHAAGGDAGRQIAALLLAWSAILALVGLMAAALRGRDRAGRKAAVAALALHLPGGGRFPGLFGALATGGFGLYALLEALEGHGPAGSPLALAVIVPLAATIAIGLRFVVGWIAGAGLSLSRLTRRHGTGAPAWFALVLSPTAPAAMPQPRGTRRGRAPPALA